MTEKELIAKYGGVLVDTSTEGQIKTALQSAAQSIIPSGSALAAGGVGARIGATVGAVGGPIGAGVGAVVGGLGFGITAALLARNTQDAVVERVAPEFSEQYKANAEVNPWSAFGGELIGGGAFASPKTLAAKAIKTGSNFGDTIARYTTQSATGQRVTSGAIAGGFQAGGDYAKDGEFNADDAKRAGAAALTGAALPSLNRVGNFAANKIPDTIANATGLGATGSVKAENETLFQSLKDADDFIKQVKITGLEGQRGAINLGGKPDGKTPDGKTSADQPVDKSLYSELQKAEEEFGASAPYHSFANEAAKQVKTQLVELEYQLGKIDDPKSPEYKAKEAEIKRGKTIVEVLTNEAARAKTDYHSALNIKSSPNHDAILGVDTGNRDAVLTGLKNSTQSNFDDRGGKGLTDANSTSNAIKEALDFGYKARKEDTNRYYSGKIKLDENGEPIKTDDGEIVRDTDVVYKKGEKTVEVEKPIRDEQGNIVLQDGEFFPVAKYNNVPIEPRQLAGLRAKLLDLSSESGNTQTLPDKILNRAVKLGILEKSKDALGKKTYSVTDNVRLEQLNRLRSDLYSETTQSDSSQVRHATILRNVIENIERQLAEVKGNENLKVSLEAARASRSKQGRFYEYDDRNKVGSKLVAQVIKEENPDKIIPSIRSASTADFSKLVYTLSRTEQGREASARLSKSLADDILEKSVTTRSGVDKEFTGASLSAQLKPFLETKTVQFGNHKNIQLKYGKLQLLFMSLPEGKGSFATREAVEEAAKKAEVEVRKFELGLKFMTALDANIPGATINTSKTAYAQINLQGTGNKLKLNENGNFGSSLQSLMSAGNLTTTASLAFINPIYAIIPSLANIAASKMKDKNLSNASREYFKRIVSVSDELKAIEKKSK